MTNILIVSPLALRYIEAPLDQWYKVGALGSMLTGHLEQLGIPDRERKRKCSEEFFMLMSSGL